MKTLSRLLIIFLLGLPSAAFAQSMPPLNANAWNIVFVPSFEASPTTNNLSARGFNHALLFGQLLNSVTAGKSGDIRWISSFSPGSRPTDMTSLQSIEPFAVLNDRAVSHILVAEGGVTTYGSPSYILSGILDNQPRGDYIVAMPTDMINRTIEALMSGKHEVLKPGQDHQYAVLSVERGKMMVERYGDGLKPGARYPALRLRPTAHYICPEKPVSFTVNRPRSSKYRFNTDQSVYFVRHAEAHPNAAFENGNLVCKGEWRAIGATEILFKKTDGKVKNIFTSAPDNLIGCNGNGACSYIRPSLTIAPYAIQHGMDLMLAGFKWNDAPSLAASLFTQNTPYSDKAFDKAATLVAWEHGNIEKAVRYLFNTIYDNPEAAKKIPAWSYTDYDTIWILRTDHKGDITFSNSCEGIDSDTLPSTCPAFPVGTGQH